jgi:hypothetical protein
VLIINIWLLEANFPLNSKIKVFDHIVSVNEDGTEIQYEQAKGVVVGHRLKAGKWEIGVKFHLNGVKIIGLYPN